MAASFLYPLEHLGARLNNDEISHSSTIHNTLTKYQLNEVDGNFPKGNQNFFARD